MARAGGTTVVIIAGRVAKTTVTAMNHHRGAGPLLQARVEGVGRMARGLEGRPSSSPDE